MDNMGYMGHILLKNIDDDLQRRFKAQATLDGFTMKEKIVRLMQLDLERMVVVQPIPKKGKEKK